MTTKERPRGNTASGSDSSHEETPLHIAASVGDVEQISILLRQNNFDVNAIGEHNFTALHYAANAGHLEVYIKINQIRSFIFLTIHIKACKILLRAGADPNLKTDEGDTALHLLSSQSFENESVYHSTVDMMLKQSCSMFSRGEESPRIKFPKRVIK